MSAIREEGDTEPVQVLFALHHNMNALDFTGPLEIFTLALNDLNDPESKAFDVTFASAEQHTMSSSGASFRAHIDYKEAHERLSEFDVLVVPGGSDILKLIKEEAEPLDLIRAFADLQEEEHARERTIMSVSTGGLLLAKKGLLQGMAATTHPDYYIKMANLCQESSALESEDRTDVQEERYVVNQGRFDLGPIPEENPYVFKKGRRTSSARKGSMARKESNARRESMIRRSTMRLGGMRIITSGGSTAGMDAALYLVSALVNHDSAQEIARVLQYTWTKGVVVDTIDV